MAAPDVSREHRPFFSFRFRFQSFLDLQTSNSVPSSRVRFGCSQNFRSSFRSSFSSLFLGFAHSRIFCLFRVFRLFRFSRVQIRNSSFSVFFRFSGFQGSKSGIPVFPFFSRLGAPNPEFRGHGSGHVWCGHVWRTEPC